MYYTPQFLHSKDLLILLLKIPNKKIESNLFLAVIDWTFTDLHVGHIIIGLLSSRCQGGVILPPGCFFKNSIIKYLDELASTTSQSE